MNRRDFLTATGACALASGFVSRRASCAADPRPNIVVVMTDDAGFSEVGCYGSEISTPNIDGLAADGIRFANFYTNARCSPTRASLLTGQYSHTVGVGDLCRPGDETPYPGYLGYMSDQCVTIAEVLRDAGYHTLMSGKWHLGGERWDVKDPFVPQEGEREKWPMGRGFDKFFGLIHGQTGYFEPWSNRPFILSEDTYPVLPADDFYATDAITDYAIQWMDESRAADSRPFFLYVPYTAPHGPLEAQAADEATYAPVYETDIGTLAEARFQGLVDEGIISASWDPPSTPNLNAATVAKQVTVAAMTACIDRGIGRLVQKLTDMGELDNTLFMYFSDNGAAGGRSVFGNWPFVGSKGKLTEGGTATHCIAHWPSVITATGSVVDRSAHVIDVMPTCVELGEATYPETYLGRSVPPMEGMSLAPIFRGEAWQRDVALHWDLYGQQAVLQGKWKLDVDANGTAHLYDLEADGTEQHDLAGSNPSKVSELLALNEEWAARCNVLPYDVVKSAQSNPDEVYFTSRDPSATVSLAANLSGTGFQWYKDPDRTNPLVDSGHYYGAQTDSLRISSPRSDDEAIYTLVYTDSVDGPTTYSVHLIEVEAPAAEETPVAGLTGLAVTAALTAALGIGNDKRS